MWLTIGADWGANENGIGICLYFMFWLFGILFCNMRGPVCSDFCPALPPTAGKPKENHTKISILCKADWPIRSGILLANSHILINPFFWSILAMWLSTFFSGQITSWCFGDLTGVKGISFLLPRILLLSLHHFHFLSGFSTYTSWLANPRLFKTWLTDYRQFSHTTSPSFLKKNKGKYP